MILYESNIDKFIESCLSKKMVPYLVKEYETNYGKIPTAAYTQLKIRIYEILLFIMNSKSINKDCGIRIDLINNNRNLRMAVVFASEDDKQINIGLVDMFSFTNIEYINNNKTAIVSGDYINDNVCIINPLIQSIAYIKYLSKNQFSDGYNYSIVPFLYDCLKENVKNANDDEMIDKVFYSGEYEAIEEKLQHIISKGNGIKALKQLHNKDGVTVNYEEDLDIFLDLVLHQVKQDRKDNRRSLYLIKNYPDISLVKEKLKSVGYENVSVITDEFSCDKIASESITLFFYFKLDESTKLNIIKYATNNDLLLREYDLDLYLDFENNIDCLTKIIEKSNDDGFSQVNLYNNYEITIVDNEKQLIDKDGYARIVIGEDVYYDSKNQLIVNDSVLFKVFSQSLIQGDKGASVYIADEKLRQHLKNRIQKTEKAKDNYKLISDAVKNGENFNSILNSIDTATKADAEKQVINSLGEDCWSKISDNSKSSLITGLLILEGLKKCDKTADFSGSCLQICKAVEYELTERYVTKYIEYFKEKYGDEALQKAPYNLLKDQKDRNAPRQFIDPSLATLGDFKFIVGVNPNGKIANKYAWNEFEDYAKNRLLKDPTNALAIMSEHISYVLKIKDDYRNKSAHKDFMDVVQGEDCYNYVVGELRKLAVIIDSYNY